MKIWTIIALFMVGCFSRSGQSSKPDGGELSTFDQFTRWGLGIGGFSAPPSSGVAQDTASWGGDDGGWDDEDWDTGGWGGGDDGSIGACWFDDICYSVVRSDCPEGGGAEWSSGSCPETSEVRTSSVQVEKLDIKTTKVEPTIGGAK